MGISNLPGKCVKNVKESAVSDHLLQCSCTIDFGILIIYSLTLIVLDSLLRRVH